MATVIGVNTMKLKRLYIFTVLLFTLLYPGCEETLPVYSEPQNILTGKIIEPTDGASYEISIFENHRWEPPLTQFVGDSTIHFRLEVQNVYNDVIEDSTYVSDGYVKLWDPSRPENYVTHYIKIVNLNRHSDVLTIRPGDKVWLDVNCRLLCDNGYFFWNGKRYIENPIGFITYDPIRLVGKAYIRLYKKLGMVVTPELSFNLRASGRAFWPG
jgi:hypothetical protein